MAELNEMVSMYVDSSSFEALAKKYGKETVEKAANVLNTYGIKIQADARMIISANGTRDTGRLINSIKPSVRIYANKVVGMVNAGAKYAQAIHEGADHKNTNEVHRHFVTFKKAPSLLTWAKRKNIIEYHNGSWWFINNKNEEVAINIDKGGLMVMQRPLKFFETPFEKYKDNMVKDLVKVITE